MERTDKIKKSRNRAVNILFAAFFCFSANAIFAQIVLPPKSPKSSKPEIAQIPQNQIDTPAENSIAVDAKVNISLCVSEGNLKINGWERNEIRAFVSGGSAVGFKVREKSKQNNAVWLTIVGFDAAKNEAANADECLAGEEIELDVPRGAIVSVKGQASETNVDSVYKARIEIVGGDIFLNNIAQGINATTYEGDVTVEKSGGAITLASTTGNIVAFDVNASEIGDVFRAKTGSGAVTLQQVGHRQMEINSNSGSMKFVGGFQSGGQYTFRTSNGSILLLIPEKSSCKINALYGYGKFDSELKLDILTENNSSKAQSLIASIGSGDAAVNLTTFSGAIRIKKSGK